VLSGEKFLDVSKRHNSFAFEGQLDCMTPEDGGTKIVRNVVDLMTKDTESHP